MGILPAENFRIVIDGNLICKGVITGARKMINQGRHVGTFAIGDQALYDDMNTNSAYMLVPGQCAIIPRLLRKMITWYPSTRR